MNIAVQCILDVHFTLNVHCTTYIFLVPLTKINNLIKLCIPFEKKANYFMCLRLCHANSKIVDWIFVIRVITVGNFIHW